MAKKLSIASLKHRVAFCSMEDVVVENAEMRLTRKDVYHGWACIEPKSASQFSVSGFTIKESTEKQTHEIYTRERRDINITSAAWFFEERLQASPRWYKILSYKDDGEGWWCFKCHLVERSDEISRPTIAQPLPDGVLL